MNTKTCTSCNGEFPASTEYFYKHKVGNGLVGLYCMCKICKRKKEYPIGSSLEERKMRKAFRDKEYRLRNPEKKKRDARSYYVRNQSLLKDRRKSWPSTQSGYRKRYRKERRQLGLYKQNDVQRLRQAVSSGIYAALKGNKGGLSWEDTVGYSLKELVSHLESRFVSGMTWENYGRNGWHIDHIRPISSFRYSSTDDMEFKNCWALSNLQPLWETENLQKGNKWSP